MPKQQERRVQNWHELLALHNKDPEIFFARLVIGDESWLYNQTTEAIHAVVT